MISRKLRRKRNTNPDTKTKISTSTEACRKSTDLSWLCSCQPWRRGGRSGRKERDMIFSLDKGKKSYYVYKAAECGLYSHCGDDSGEDPPVLIPNTEVKLSCAESTLGLPHGRLGCCRIHAYQHIHCIGWWKPDFYAASSGQKAAIVTMQGRCELALPV